MSATTARSSLLERIEIDLVAQTRAEALERARGVVLAPEEATVDRRLDAGSGRAEQRRDSERRGGDRQAGPLVSGRSSSWSTSTLPRYATPSVAVSAP